MKKSTYLILGTLVAVGLFSFFFRIIFFTSVESNSQIYWEEPEPPKVISADSIPPFHTINIYSDVWFECMNDTTIPNPKLVVNESGTDSVPQIYFNTNCADLLTGSISDSTLYISLKENDYWRDNVISIPKATTQSTIEITVPKGTLKAIDSGGFPIELVDFTHSSLRIYDPINGLFFLNSTFEDLEIQTRDVTPL